MGGRGEEESSVEAKILHGRQGSFWSVRSKAPFGPFVARLLLVRSWQGSFVVKTFFSPGSPTNFFSRPKLFRRGQKLFLSRLADKNFSLAQNFFVAGKNFFSPESPTKIFSRPKLFRRGQKLFLSRLADTNFSLAQNFFVAGKNFSSPESSRVESLR